MDKKTLLEMEYIEENANGRVTFNMYRIKGVDIQYVERILTRLQPDVSEDNYAQLVLSLYDNGIMLKNMKCDRTMDKTENKVSINIKMHLDGKYYRGIKLSASYNPGKKQEKSEESKKNFLNAVGNAFNKDAISLNEVSEFVKKYSRMKAGNIHVSFDKEDFGTKIVEKYGFDKKGLVISERIKDGKLVKKEERLKVGVVRTLFMVDGKCSKSITVNRRTEFPEREETVYAYDGAGHIIKSKSVFGAEKVGEIRNFAMTYCEYVNEKAVKIKIKDVEFGKMEYDVSDSSIKMILEQGTVVLDLTKDFMPSDMSMKGLLELNTLECGLVELKKYVSQVVLKYDSLLENIYKLKRNIALMLSENQEVITYIGDKGNVTIYDFEGTRLAYFAHNILDDEYKIFSKIPGVVVEQRIKSSDDVDEINKIYWLGNQVGPGKGVYAFHRVIKALCQNENTPVSILSDIAKAIIGGKYDRVYLLDLVQNKSVTTPILQMIINSKPQMLVLDTIALHPNKPELM